MKIGSNISILQDISRSRTKANTMAFEKIVENLKVSENHNNRDIYTRNSTLSMHDIGVYSRTDIKDSLDFPLETQRYKIELANELEGVQAYIIRDKETGKGLYIREDKLVIQKDTSSGMEFVINMEQPFCSYVLMTDELKSMLGEIANIRNFDLKETDMQGGLVVNQDMKTGLKYLSMKGNEAKGVAVIMTSKEDREVFDKLVDEFAKYSVCGTKDIAALYAAWEISGNLRRGTEGFTYLTPNGITYIPYDGDPKKAWEIEMSESYYATARKNLFSNIDFEKATAWSEIFKEANIINGFFEIWDKFYPDNNGTSYQFKRNQI